MKEEIALLWKFSTTDLLLRVQSKKIGVIIGQGVRHQRESCH